MEDETLAELSATNAFVADNDEFGEFVVTEQESMVRLAVLMVGSRAIAEEIVQDAFSAVGLRWSRIDAPGAYLRTTVVNGCRQTRRRQHVEDRHLLKLRSERPTPTVHPLPAIELRDALGRLSANQRSVVVLRYYLDLPDGEIAELLQCRPSTVRSLARRGLTRLRKELQ